jgi:hypothetical protein
MLSMDTNDMLLQKKGKELLCVPYVNVMPFSIIRTNLFRKSLVKLSMETNTMLL